VVEEGTRLELVADPSGLELRAAAVIDTCPASTPTPTGLAAAVTVDEPDKGPSTDSPPTLGELSVEVTPASSRLPIALGIDCDHD